MKIRDLLPFNWKKERADEKETHLPQRPRENASSDFDRFFENPFVEFGLMRSNLSRSLSPKVNVSETRKEIRIEAELPGMNEKDIDVTIENGYLKIRGEKTHETKDEKAHCVECSYGFFERTLPLPDYAQADKAKAKYKKGVLTLSVPKTKQKETGKRIPVSVA